jgi:hypothetical protein
VNGALVVDDGNHRHLDRGPVIDDARTALGRLLEQTGLDSYIAERGSWQWNRQ